MQHPNIAGMHNPPGLAPEETFERLRGRIHTPRWGRHLDSYDLTRTDKGWITHRRGGIDNQAAPDGSPAWFGELANDSITWVRETPFFIEGLWQGLTDGALAPDMAQEAFTRYCGFLTRLNQIPQHHFGNYPQDWAEHVWEELEAEYPDPPAH